MAGRLPSLLFHTAAPAATSGPSVHRRTGSAGSSAATTAARTAPSTARSSSLATAAGATFTPMRVRASVVRKARS